MKKIAMCVECEKELKLTREFLQLRGVKIITRSTGERVYAKLVVCKPCEKKPVAA